MRGALVRRMLRGFGRCEDSQAEVRRELPRMAGTLGHQRQAAVTAKRGYY
jgi:hypothetical protein